MLLYTLANGKKLKWIVYHGICFSNHLNVSLFRPKKNADRWEHERGIKRHDHYAINANRTFYNGLDLLIIFFYCCCFEIPNSQCYSLWMYVSNCPIESNKGAHDLTLHRNNSFSISFTAWVRCSSCKSLKSTVFTVRTPLLLFDLEEFIKQTVSVWVKSRKMRFQTGRNIRISRRWTSLNASHDINKKNRRTTKQNEKKFAAVMTH